MILKLLILFYSWVWNVEPWTPKDRTDLGLVIVGILMLDPFLIIGSFWAVSKVIDVIKEAKKK